MDEKTIEEVKDLLYRAAEKHDIRLQEIVVFGSRAGEDYRERSDVDLLIVSPDFEGVAWNKRPREFYREWDYDKLPEPEFICLTPEEFEEQKKIEANIVKDAVEKGVRV